MGAWCYLGNLKILEVSRYTSSRYVWHVGYMGPFWSNGQRADYSRWLPRVPNVALSSSAVAGEGHCGQLELPGGFWVPLTWTPASLCCTSQVCMGILEMLRHLKCKPVLSVSSCQTEDAAFSFTPWLTQTTQNQAEVKRTGCRWARESRQLSQRPNHKWKQRFQSVPFIASRN